MRKKDTVCKFFSKGSCKHGQSGENCNYAHPEVCRKFTQHGTRKPRGCNLGKNCKFLHPVMYIHSLRKAECMNNRCSFRHILGTKRTLPNTTKDLSIKGQNQQGTTANPNNGVSQTPTTEEAQANLNHFLEMFRLIKAEILKEMDTRMENISNKINQIHTWNQNPMKSDLQQSQTQNPQHQPAPASHYVGQVLSTQQSLIPQYQRPFADQSQQAPQANKIAPAQPQPQQQTLNSTNQLSNNIPMPMSYSQMVANPNQLHYQIQPARKYQQIPENSYLHPQPVNQVQQIGQMY